MKRPILWITIFFVAETVGCRTATEPQLYAPNDPLARAGLFGEGPLPNSQNLDAAVVIFRHQGFGVNIGKGSVDGRMAFELNGSPDKVDGASINGVLIPWIDTGGGLYNEDIYAKFDTSFGLPDSVTFSYANFDGESFTATDYAALSFGSPAFPDTISASKGSVIAYQQTVPVDSIQVYVNAYDTSLYYSQPDNGSIVFQPNQLPYDANVAKHGYVISWTRWNWTVRTSPSGKKIGIYSSIEIPGVTIPAKP